ncbi:hypothetical protein PBY51_018191 [Eleginops maclovinus]|uniref:L1 transposable element RRM domain-containing protein n=1 Tax=Eleginops maclovinus TaxID=56733 RepID=A0AAN7XGG7_ELEMC|nr:hypothetical protein PBY51_018191 [Eleginops maclovinus]
MENRQRRFNLRLVGLPEKTEKGDLVSFLNQWLPEILGPENFVNPPSIDQAFRLPRAAASANNNPNRTPAPRAIIMKFCWLNDRDRMMKAARKKKAVEFEGTRLMVFPDLSAEIQQRRRLFDGVKSRLHSLQIEFRLNSQLK